MPVPNPLAVIAAAFLLLPVVASAAETVPSNLQQARQEGALQTALALNRLLNPFRIEVQVQGATAHLQGQVENEVERQLAEQVALATRGIEKVQNDLQVNAELVEQPLERRAYAQRLEDATLAAIIRARLLWSTHTQAAPIEVESREGVVTLRGQVSSAEAKELAGVLATSTEGVFLVNNLISLNAADMAKLREEQQEVRSDPQLSDAWINDKVQTSFMYSRNLDGPNIKVATQEGVVRLSGEVVSSEQKTIAVEVARQIRGVRGVDADMLKVASNVQG
ncbi:MULTISPECIES: BON domain-containing protein [Pseudomonas]|uniref:BON domain-containing protein n=1 Tax=Pseudomonas sp. Hg7Tf TaxID=3236988 RepID=A0AB39I271_9PSED|nr:MULTISPECIES: BON domain-containing protein [Pseudomonas]KJK06875.1 transporter [Pseudomonas sp. 5]MDD1977443.1 BON domain-containing protein [Pseudomonas putida]MDH2560706.1 BON domain-containing protein [Pseudomonas sp. Hg5Tf]QYX46532.1 BON domain-containing protein [Pseudomonas sp. S11A 273]